MLYVKKIPTADRSFEDALRRIAQVPKAEMDAEESKHHAMRKRLNDKKAHRKPKR